MQQDNIALIEQESVSSSIQVNEANVSITEAYERGKVDINFFAGLCMPTVCIFELPAFYVLTWQLLCFRELKDIGKLLRFALGLPRSHAKTTFIKILIAWLIVYDKVSFALIVCANSDLAESLLADIHDILSSPNLVFIYGDWEAGLAIDSADTKKAAYHRRDVILVARGWAAGVRGINLKNQRPDLIFCDDVQTRKNDESPTERGTLLKELAGTIFKAIAPRGDRLIIYVGNMYSEDCILNLFKNSPRWISMVTGAILSTGKPLWPELFSLEDLMESYEHDEGLGLSDIWFAEVMNDPRSQAKSLLHTDLPHCAIQEIEDPDGVFITIDPAGFRDSSDDNVIAVHYKHNGLGYVVEVSRGILDPQQLILEALRLAVKHGASLIGVEDVGYQQTLGFWLTHFIKEKHIQGILVIPMNPHGRSKEARIRQFIAELYAKTYFLLSVPVRRDFVWQASMYKVGKKANKDDLLDCIAYGLDIRNEYWHVISNLRRINSSVEGEAKVVASNTPF